MIDVTRRQFTSRGLAGLGLALSSKPLTLAAAQANSNPETLSLPQWQVVDAITQCIIPSVDGLGAKEAHCVNFIDKALTREESAHLNRYQEGLGRLESACQARYGASFTALDVGDQIKLLEHLEDGAFEEWDPTEQQIWFGLLWYHTILGFASAPRFGGNHHLTGWRVMNFPGHLHEAGGISDAQVQGIEPIKWTFDAH
jgi:hypothetical protein